jgi:hypothetical protein
LKGLDGSLFAYPEKAGDADIDLVDQRQVLVALGVVDFVHYDGIDLSQNSVFEAPGDDVLDSIEDLFQEVRNASAVSFQDKRRAQRARNNM